MNEQHNRNSNRPDWVAVFLLIYALLIGVILVCFAFAPSSKALELETIPDTAVLSETSSVASETQSETVNDSPSSEFEVNNDLSGSNRASAVTYNSAYDVTTSDSYCSILYDIFLNQANTYDDFIIYRSATYQYVLIYGSIKDDLSFSKAHVVTMDYNNVSQTGKRYTFTYSDDVSGSFNPGQYTFISNVEHSNALLFHNYFMRKEIHGLRIAVFIIAILTILSQFTFFKGGIRTV